MTTIAPGKKPRIRNQQSTVSGFSPPPRRHKDDAQFKFKKQKILNQLENMEPPAPFKAKPVKEDQFLAQALGQLKNFGNKKLTVTQMTDLAIDLKRMIMKDNPWGYNLVP
jgi:hypothetical protein